jgi:hypothetical protein
MLEDSMSVWPAAATGGPILSGTEGALVSVSIEVDARSLESLLEALAQAPFPINPEIFHDAAIAWRRPDGSESVEDVTLVEFPAYLPWLDPIREAVGSYGFDSSRVHVTGMLDEIRLDGAVKGCPPGSPFVLRRVLKHKK